MTDQMSFFSRNSGPYAVDRQIKALGGERILGKHDLVELNEAQDRVLKLMCDGGWQRASAIIHAADQREGLRRLRELRSKGYIIERRRVGDERDFQYRLVVK
jgi:hypothetical protein